MNCNLQGSTLIINYCWQLLAIGTSRVQLTKKTFSCNLSSCFYKSHLKKHFFVAGEINSWKLQELRIFLHAIAEWQSLYYCVHCLNQLFPIPIHLLEPQEFLQCSNLHSYVNAVCKDGVDKVIEDNKLDKDMYGKYYSVITNVDIR